jgi:hypothetical protein
MNLNNAFSAVVQPAQDITNVQSVVAKLSKDARMISDLHLI